MKTHQRRVLAVAACICALAGCSSDKSPSSTTSASDATTTSGGPSSPSTVLETSTTLLAAAATVAPTTELSDANANSIADCVAYIPIGAVLADKEATDLWAIVGRDASKLEGLCTTLLTQSPATIASLSLKLTAFSLTQTTLPGAPADSSATTIASATTVPVPTTVPAAPMPNVICTNLQDAETLIQAATGNASTTFDASGAARTQDVIADWIVVSQVPEPGGVVDGAPQLGVVKVGEPSDCLPTAPSAG